MQERIESPATSIPGFMDAGLKLAGTIKAAATAAGVSDGLVHLIYLRASQINGCGFCVDLHWRDAAKAGESDERIHGVAAFREMPFFTEAERAALALVEAETRIADNGVVSDAVWKEAEKHWSAAALGAIVAATAMINMWNRLNVAVRRPAGGWKR